MESASSRSRRGDVRRGPAPRRATTLLGAALVVLPGAIRAQSACSAAPDGRANLSGVVRAIPGELPLPGATVTASWRGGNRQMETGPEGRYAFCSLRAGLAVRVHAVLDPYRGADVEVELAPGANDLPLGVDLRAGAGAKPSARVAGRVVDVQTLEPVAGAQIALDDGEYLELSDEAGRFLIEDVLPGAGVLRVRHLAYGENETALRIPDDGTLEIEVRLAPEALPVEPIAVTVLGLRSFKLDVSGFYERRDLNERLGLGHYLTRGDIEGRGAARVSHILMDVPRVAMIDGMCATTRCNIPVITSGGGDCRRIKDVGGELVVGASLYLDGRRVRVVNGRGDAVVLSGVDDFLVPGDVAGIEVYTGAGDLPGEFADANAQRCGAIVIWTGR